MNFIKILLITLTYVATISFIFCLPVPIGKSNRIDINRIDHHETSPEEHSTENILLFLTDENDQDGNPWDRLVLSLRNGFPSTPTDSRRRFSHFYRKTTSEPSANKDRIVFPGSEETAAELNGEAVTFTDTIVVDVLPQNMKAESESSSEEDEEVIATLASTLSSGDSIESSASAETASTMHNEQIPIEVLTTWLWENMKPTSENKSHSIRRPGVHRHDDIGTHSLYHGPKIKKNRVTKIECPPGQKPNHFGECKLPVTLKQSE